MGTLRRTAIAVLPLEIQKPGVEVAATELRGLRRESASWPNMGENRSDDGEVLVTKEPRR